MLNSVEEYDNATRLAQGIAVVRCTADWCGSCKVIAPQYAAMRIPGVSFYTIDVERVEDFAEANEATKLPCFFIFKNGKPHGKILGADLAALTREVNKIL